MKNFGKSFKKPVIVLLSAAIASCFAGCAGGGTASKNQNLLSYVTADEPPVLSENEKDELRLKLSSSVSGFGLDILKNEVGEAKGNDDNLLISPLSIYYALAMTANGATGTTLSQMEDVLGMNCDDLNKSLLFIKTLSEELSDEEADVLKLANSIWFDDSTDFTVKDNFLKTNKSYYDADIYKLKMDGAAIEKINNWVNEKTDKQIEKIIDEFPPLVRMVLVNALTFEAAWTDPYKDADVDDATFTCEDGSTRDIELMYSTEDEYFENDYCTGFLKPYIYGRYSFVALKPANGENVNGLLSKLTGDELTKLLHWDKSDWLNVEVHAAIPKLSYDYDTELNDALENLGMKAAFDGGFEDISDTELAISQVLHKTHIDIDQAGTKAAAATAVIMTGTVAIMPEEKEIKEVYLDSPFVYMIIDNYNKIPVFMGAVKTIE